MKNAIIHMVYQILRGLSKRRKHETEFKIKRQTAELSISAIIFDDSFSAFKYSYLFF